MTKEQVINRLEALCVRQECCYGDIRRKAVSALDGDVSSVEEIMSHLVENGFVDDARYAVSFAREKSRITGWGPEKIKCRLLTKGICREDIASALAQIDGDAAASRLDKLMRSRWSVLKDDPYCKFKLIKYALSRGYLYDDVEAAYNRIIESK